MELIWVMFGFFTFITIVFVIIAFLHPEWVGITGKRALEIQRHQNGDDLPEEIALKNKQDS